MQLTAVLALGLAALAAADVVKRPPRGDGYNPRKIRQPKDKRTCEDGRKAAVGVCEVYPRSDKCKGLIKDWRNCIDTKWGFDIKAEVKA